MKLVKTDHIEPSFERAKNYNNQSIYRIVKNDKRNPKKYDITISVTLLLA